MCCVLDIIIVGNGKMGFSLADQLASEDHSITIVDTHEAALRRASDTLDVMSVKGNGVSAAVLREAGAEHADLLIAATSTDEVNMVCCLTAKKMGTSYTIARIRNQEYTSWPGGAEAGPGHRHGHQSGECHRCGDLPAAALPLRRQYRDLLSGAGWS